MTQTPYLVTNDILIPEMARILADGKEVIFTPSGTSMRPWIEGDCDTVSLIKKTTCRVGDIVLARIPLKASKCAYVLHRVIAVDGKDVTLMGDGNLVGVEHCTTDDIFGTVVRITSPHGWRKPVTRGRLWRVLLPKRSFLLKIYRHLPRI